MAHSNPIRIVDQRTPEDRDRSFLPGAGKSWLLPFYDAFTRLAGVRALHRRTVELAGVEPGQTVVDVGCGTGNLSFTVLAAQPSARVTGLDPDADALRRAARKARRRNLSLALVQGYADRIPADDAALDHVISALALHHIDDAGRIAFARDALRALRPGGTITIADFEGVKNAGHPARRRRLAHSGNHGNGIVTLLADAGFGDAQEVAHADHRIGRVTFVQATLTG
ncbi:class I SAM-dependent methyltransferase [Paractinoplanes durhamensis]|uniref:Methyltransferase domain-containing protein n=1 Tax=Paractinoplanes durhamensis TaxID=113563 RepID=A0ABQ3Z2J1_9ACTN|nr:class I SAM-dependent methyltransferase [Actinoplanes durhamensis]GIE04036.1 hypothetical protein Adu01nite_53860 [Actinoplanes durhamensis]